MLYFTNSIGGAIGVLASGFILIPQVGLPGAMMTAGLLNFLVALVTWVMVKKLPEMPAVSAAPASAAGLQDRAANYRVLLAAALITGMASFCYEIGWLRMLSLVLGASTHAFELMLSSFILGLALGGWWIKRRIERTADLWNLLGVIQLVMGFLALMTLFVYGQTFDWMSVVMQTFTRTEAGYVGVNWASHLIASALMLPASFCAGMTLPVITFAALRSGLGERAIGGVYAANTVGAITGIVLAVHVFMPAFNAKGVIIAGAAMDFALGLAILAMMIKGKGLRRAMAGAVVGVGAFTVTFMAADVDPLKVTSGVFRHGFSRSSYDEVLYLRDGKTANVSLTRSGSEISIATNGKVDASVNMGPGLAGIDEITQTLLGALPLMLHPEPKNVAVIGFGSGMTTHVLLSDPGLETVDSIEIEPRIIEAAHQGFFPRNRQAYADPRSRLHIEDAKTFFSVTNKQYDIIVSEPSNPWVSGISSLFTKEFYRNTASHLRDGGLLVQWVQLYEIDFDSVASIIKALSPEFQDYAVFISDRNNLIIVGAKNSQIGPLGERVFGVPGLRDDLQRVSVLTRDDVRARRVGDKQLLDSFFQRSLAPVNSDYFPFIDHRAARARFMGKIAAEPVLLLLAELPIHEMLSAASPGPVSWQPLSLQNPADRALGQIVTRFTLEGHDDVTLGRMRDSLAVARIGAPDCGKQAPAIWQAGWVNVGRFVAPYLDPGRADAFWNKLLPPQCRERMSVDAKRWYRLLRAVAARDAPAMIEHGGELLRRADAQTPARDTRYAAASVILGQLALQNPEGAREVWGLLQERLPGSGEGSIELRWLQAITIARLQGLRN